MLLTRAEQRLDQVERQRKNEQLGALVGDVGEGLQIAQLLVFPLPLDLIKPLLGPRGE